MHGHRNLILSIGDQVQPVAEPALELRPRLAGARINPIGFMLAPVGVGIGGLAAGALDSAAAVAVDPLAVEAQVPAKIGQRLHQLPTQGGDHPRDQPQRLFEFDDVGEKAREVPAARDRRLRLPGGFALRAQAPAQLVAHQACQRLSLYRQGREAAILT